MPYQGLLKTINDTLSFIDKPKSILILMEPKGKPLNQGGKSNFCVIGNLFKINDIEQ